MIVYYWSYVSPGNSGETNLDLNGPFLSEGDAFANLGKVYLEDHLDIDPLYEDTTLFENLKAGRVNLQEIDLDYSGGERGWGIVITSCSLNPSKEMLKAVVEDKLASLTPHEQMLLVEELLGLPASPCADAGPAGQLH